MSGRDLLKEKVELLRPSSPTVINIELRERQVQILNKIVQQPSRGRSISSASPQRWVQEFRAMGEVQQVQRGSTDTQRVISDQRVSLQLLAPRLLTEEVLTREVEGPTWG